MQDRSALVAPALERVHRLTDQPSGLAAALLAARSRPCGAARPARSTIGEVTLVIFGLAEEQPAAVLKPFTSEETQEVVLIESPIELGFPMHSQVVLRFFTETAKARRGLKQRDI
jgi:hypothetical protein